MHPEQTSPMRPTPAPQKLIPQYSLRWLLAMTAVCAGMFAVLAWGLRGHAWALGVSIGLGALLVLFAVFGFMFGLIWMVSRLFVSPRPERYVENAVGPLLPRGVSPPKMPQPPGDDAT
ncbi:MAG: hypothetical protein JW818_00335 [Pirellulales bacterium]|nr:hypothetical protein [Pirellulales bacterium]